MFQLHLSCSPPSYAVWKAVVVKSLEFVPIELKHILTFDSLSDVLTVLVLTGRLFFTSAMRVHEITADVLND